jgi:hypothetical protein
MRWFGLTLAFAIVGCNSTEPCKDNTLAFVMSQDFIKRQLKSPSTAKFPYTTDRDVSVTQYVHEGKCAFTVRTYVDAQNSFGAIVRQNFRVDVSPDDATGNSWSLINIIPY